MSVGRGFNFCLKFSPQEGMVDHRLGSISPWETGSP